MLSDDEEASGEAKGLPATQKSTRLSVFHPPAYRGVVADWPLPWRERWGRRANDLEANGLYWRDAESQAFVEVWKSLGEESGIHGLGASKAERN